MSELDPQATQDHHAGLPLRDDSKLEELPQRIGRYRVEKIIGQGGFGLVYLAQDETLDRPVAVKVPHARLVSRVEDAELYLAEARTVASLEHPYIVPVHDVGSSAEFPCFVVSRFVSGCDLATHLKQTRLSYTEVAELVATIAEALHYAHKRGIVHRDVKPGNILIDKEGKPFIVDFGLALREENIGKGARHVGTPAYMSPEQARGEGHRVDGRSDVFSLGVVFYECLAGRRPFRGDTQAELFEQVTSYEAKPLRQHDDNIPKELERVCQKAMAKRASERYSTAKDFAEDVRHFMHEQTITQSGASPGGVSSDAPQKTAATSASTPAGSNVVSSASTILGSSKSHPIKIVPKGLRSFDAHDADFFLELLPGPRDREGLPDSLRFWKTRIEETDPDNTFAVGLIYGPSGCGKSSLVKAGLLPRLSEDVIQVYVEATPEETETRLLHGLRKRCPALEDNLSLKATLAALRRGQGIPAGKKVLIVLDQFEQWLHAKRDEENTDLVQALRQCDGGRVQCIVMVRDDFWLAVSRFLRELEVRLLEGHNSALVDLFDLDHARKVLAAFGRAFGKLPDSISETKKEQKEFIRLSVAGLAEEGKVICVRLALFAEMMKGKAWTVASLKDVGGTQGVGVTFLEETFSASTSPPEHRYHQKAARAVLKDLLPDYGTDIKGYMRSHADLLEASGYGSRPKDFDDLILILDSEIRLITPTDPEGKEIDDDSMSHTQAGQKYFQLTHDYLVHSLRDWLTRKQKETRKGRAELKLFDTSVTWNAKPENRFLPSWREFLSIRFLTDKKKWTEPQREMMGKAARVYATRGGLLASAVVILSMLGFVIRGQVLAQQELTRVEGLVGRLISAEPGQIPIIVSELESNPQLAAKTLSPLLQQEVATLDEKRSQLHARLASVGRDSSLVEPLLEELLSAKVTYVAPIRELLRPYASQQRKKLETLFRDSSANMDNRFRAAMALADYVPASETEFWTEQDLQLVARQLVSSNAEFQPLLRNILQQIKPSLLDNLESIFSDESATAAERVGAANALADYARDDLSRVLQRLLVANVEQYRILFPLVEGRVDSAALQVLRDIVGQQPADDWDEARRVALGRLRAGAAITLLKLGDRKAPLEALKANTDMESISQFAARCKDRAVSTADLLALWDEVDRIRGAATGDVRQVADRMLYGLLVTLGSYAVESLPLEQRAVRKEQLLAMYANDPSSGVHGASGWLLRKWGEHEEVERIDNTPVPYDPQREWFVKRFEPRVDGNCNQLEKSESFSITFVVFPAGQYQIGSPASEKDHVDRETQSLVTLTRPLAIADREICWRQYSPHDSDSKRKTWKLRSNRTLTNAEPSLDLNWYEAVGYCRWLGQVLGMTESEQSYSDPDDVEKDADGNPRNWPLRLDRGGFRLPSESEWEIACRGGMLTAYSFGSDRELLGKYARYQDYTETWSKPVGQLPPNSRGLFDMHGNLWEWTHDFSGGSRDNEAVDPIGPERGSDRVLRGGAWDMDARLCRAASRSSFDPSRGSINGGFRVALNPSSQVPAEPESGKE